MIIFSGIVSWIGYRGFTDTLQDQYAEEAFRIAKIAAMSIDPDRMDKYASSGGRTGEYLEVWNNLNELCNASGSTFIYVIRPDRSDYGHIRFLFSTINRRNTTYPLYKFGYLRETTNDDYRTKYRRLYETDSEKELVVRDKGYIETDHHITAMVPLRGADGKTKAILCVQQQMSGLAAPRRHYVNRVILTLILLMVVILAVQGSYLNRTVLRPVMKITEEAVRFARENEKAEEKLSDRIRSRDEIGQLAGSIDYMEEKIDNYVTDLTKITAERERISTELSLAARIQMDALPNVFPAFPDQVRFDIYAKMDPAKEIGGDFYDFFMVDEDHLCLIIADVSGKGIPAALFMMSAKIVLENFSLLGNSPAEVLWRTNHAICDKNPEEMFVTVWIGLLEISTGKVTASNAGHEYPVLMQPDGKFELIRDRHGLVIGGLDNVPYREYEFTMEPGSKLFVYTDGVPEAVDSGNNMFGTGRMLDALNGICGGSPQEVICHVREAVDAFTGDVEQFDDMTMLCLEILKPEKE